MTDTTLKVPVHTDAVEDIAGTGLAEIQLIFDQSMARFASLFEVWVQASRETVRGVADTDPSVPQAA